MARSDVPDEVQVLRFFESSQIEKAQAVFNIVSEKMRERLRGSSPEGAERREGRRRIRSSQAEVADEPGKTS